ncbi:hypothetical protein O6H91_19G029800 [Diphasiastrum complanatum]|uniref:Uncharacterized protein n=1 Tax=Diphasiastrum complanatum TaxID=34168 RepID=A0ACC2ATX1_DIPCM|nr:hypothetical protein O6H91_19G029800 [Diphasiastrum complanatum]
MSCNGCRVLRKGCSDKCILRTCLQWIDSAEAQGHATMFVAKFFGRAGLLSFISGVHEKQRPALFRSLLYEACGRTVNPVFGAVGLLWSGKWDICHAAVETVLRTGSLRPLPQAVVVPSSENIPISSPSKTLCTSNRVTKNLSRLPHWAQPVFEVVQTTQSGGVHHSVLQYENYGICEPKQLGSPDVNMQQQVESPGTPPPTNDQRTFPREGHQEIVKPNVSRKRAHSCTEISSNVSSAVASRLQPLEGMARNYPNLSSKSNTPCEVQQPKSTSTDLIDLDLTLSSYSAVSFELRLGVRSSSPPLCVSVCSDSSLTSLSSADLAVSPVIGNTQANNHSRMLNLL